MSLTKGGVYVIKNAGDGLNVNVKGAKLDQGTAIISWPASNGADNETWVAIPTANGFKFRTQINGNGGQVLDEAVSDHSADLWTDHNGNNQEWKIEPVGFALQNVASGRFLKAGGKGEVIHTIPENNTDELTWWTFNAV